MRPNIPQDQALIGLSRDYRSLIAETDLAVDHPERAGKGAIPGVEPLAHYIGTEKCATCHAEETAIWKKSEHSRAFSSLVHRDSQSDPTCIECHTVGFGTQSGYRRSFGDKKLTDVGCESCHGPGSKHVESWSAGKKPLFKFRPLGAGDCMTCHHGELTRPFDRETFWPQIKHGKKK